MTDRLSRMQRLSKFCDIGSTTVRITLTVALSCWQASDTVRGFAQQSTVEDATVLWQVPIDSEHSGLFDRTLQRVTGKIARLDDQSLQIQQTGQTSVTTIASDQIAGVIVNWNSEQARLANQQYADSDWLASVRSSQAAIAASNMPLWQQRLLSLQIISALQNFQRIGLAAKVFVLVRQQNPPLLSLAYAPVPWASGDLNPAIVAEVSPYMLQDDAAQFVAASWLIETSNQAEAIVVLKRLSGFTQVPLNKLATAQLWRTSAPQKFVSTELPDAIKLRDSLPYCLQAGPTAAIADRIERAGEFERAFYYWIEVAQLSRDLKLPIHAVAIRHLDDLADRANLQKEWQALQNTLR